MAPHSLRRLRTACRSRWFAASLALGLVLANLAFALHHYDFAAHRGPHACAVCMASSNLGQALAGAANPEARRDFAGPRTEYRGPHAVARAEYRYHARAPPV